MASDLGDDMAVKGSAERALAAREAPTFDALIGGERIELSGDRAPLVDPATGETWATAAAGPMPVEDSVAAAAAAQPAWAELDASERGKILWKLAAHIEENAERIARLEVLSNGKTLRTTRREIARTSAWYRFFGGAADKIEGHALDLSPTSEARVAYEPVGVVAAMTPFNGPISLGTWKMAPALAAGNTVVLKPPLEAPASTLALAEVILEAELPAGVVNVIPGGAEVGQALVAHPDVDMVSFTGSTSVARQVAGQVAGRLKRFVCEAGGKSAQIVFEDADLDAASISARQHVFSNTGQSCVAASRLLVQRSVWEQMLERLIRDTEAVRVGNPFDPATHVGPLASAKQWGRVRGFVEQALADGATLAAGGGPPDLGPPWDGGFFFRPTVLTGVGPEMQVWQEEVFGPVLVVVPFDDEDEAVTLANDSRYGLAAGLWTDDIRRAHRVSRRLEAGTVWVNTFRVMHYRVPFGGYKESGLGRENGLAALREFLNVKATVTSHAPPVDLFGY